MNDFELPVELLARLVSSHSAIAGAETSLFLIQSAFQGLFVFGSTPTHNILYLFFFSPIIFLTSYQEPADPCVLLGLPPVVSSSSL
ncbi:hypothetical protein BGX38DRAFT_1201657, partial [Terfezia claveryi]